ncbi:MAG: GNAT family N-acetyltransferase [Lachnospiraceae bacterium]|nr:GNAT family N-acetyltransferase [Lachnospiraceae bacterium]
MEIRYINQNDNLLEISNIYENSWKYAYKNIIPQDYLDSIPTGQWVNRINKAGMNNLVIIEDGLIMGTAGFCKSRWEKYSNYGEIVSIYFLPEYIGKGYGRLLLNKCIEELKHCGFSKILLWVLEDNHRARSFYEKNGFICSEVFLEDNIGGKDLREVLYFFV